MAKLSPPFHGSLPMRASDKSSYPPFSLERLPQKPKRPFPKFGSLAILLVALLIFTTSCKASPDPTKHSYSFMIGSGASITLTPIIPPKALSTLVSDWLQVNVDVGSFHFSTLDPAFMCFENLALYLFTTTVVSFAGFFIAAYNGDCRTGTTGPASHIGAALALQGSDQGNYLAMWQIPQSDIPGCTTDSSGATSCTLTTPTPVPPPVTPTVAPVGPSGTPIDSGAALIITNAQVASSVDSQCNATNPTNSFQTGQTIYVTFDLNLPSDGYFIDKWYEDGNLLTTSPPGFFKVGTPHGCGPCKGCYANPGNGMVELYWCTLADCSDERLAGFVNFTVS